jgi:hypothetical protein
MMLPPIPITSVNRLPGESVEDRNDRLALNGNVMLFFHRHFNADREWYVDILHPYNIWPNTSPELPKNKYAKNKLIGCFGPRHSPKIERCAPTAAPTGSFYEQHKKCYRKEARAMLEGKHWQGKNRCVKLPGDDTE